MFEPVKSTSTEEQSRGSVTALADSIFDKTGSGLFTGRSLRQFGVFAAGAGFFAASMMITKRSIMRRYQREIPKFFQPSHPTSNGANGAMDALEALNLATINVVSIAMMTAGGMLWAFDVSSLNDMKKKFHVDAIKEKSHNKEFSDQEIEEWLASILMRKEFKAIRDNHGITDGQLKAMIKGKKDEVNREEERNDK